MNLQIRDLRAHNLAERLAKRRGMTLTDAVIAALEADLACDAGHRTLAERAAEITAALKSISQPGGRELTKPEIDALWGHD